MSQNSPVPSLAANHTRPQEGRGSLERKRTLPHADENDISPTTERRESLRSRPLSWHPSAPVEPPLKTSQKQPLSIGGHSILNHPSGPTAGAEPRASLSVDSGREGMVAVLGEQLSSSDSPSHSRFPSASTVHLPSPSMHPARPPPPVLSPGMRNHQGNAPRSPSARFVSAGAYPPPKAGQLPSLQTVAPGSPVPMDPALGHRQPASIHSTPTFPSHRVNTNQTPTPSSKEASPTTPVSVLSQLGRSSPAIVPASLPHSTALYMSSSPYAAVDPITRLPKVLSGPRHPVDETTRMGPPSSEPPLPGMIPCFLDLKSGSSSQAEKRKANSDASRRFRNRKRNEMQMEQKITTQQEEIRKQGETIQKQAEELRHLREQRDFYHSERDFFREQLSRFVPPSQIPARPASPRGFGLSLETPTTSERERKSTWSGPDAARKTGEAPSGSQAPGSNVGPVAPRPAGTWSSPSSAYPATQTERALPPGGRQPGRMPQGPGTWKRAA